MSDLGVGLFYSIALSKIPIFYLFFLGILGGSQNLEGVEYIEKGQNNNNNPKFGCMGWGLNLELNLLEGCFLGWGLQRCQGRSVLGVSG